MTNPADSLQLELLVPGRIRAGDAVRFTLRVRNPTPRKLDLYLQGRTATFDVVVTRAEGDTIWRRLEGEIIPAIVHLRALDPGEQFEVSGRWDQRGRDGRLVIPGRYIARALLLVEGAPLESPAVQIAIVGTP